MTEDQIGILEDISIIFLASMFIWQSFDIKNLRKKLDEHIKGDKQ